MDPSTVPARPSSETSRETSMVAWTKRQDFLAAESAELKRELSTTSFKDSPQKYTALKIQEMENYKALIRHETSFFELQAEQGLLDKETLKERRRANIQRIISLGEAQWQQTKALHEFQEDAGLVSPITPDTEHACKGALLSLHNPDKPKGRPGLFGPEFAQPWSDHWCPILKNFTHAANSNVEAPIVPHSFPLGLADYLFGPDSATRIHSTDDTMIMHPWLKSQFEQHNFVLVPVDPTETPLKRWKIVVTMDDGHGFRKGCLVRMADLDGRELVFKNNARPAARFLYYHFLISIIICSAKKKTSHEWLMKLMSGKPFGTWGKWVRKSVMVAMARQLGDVDVEFECLLKKDDVPFPDERSLSPEEENEIARRCLKASWDAGKEAEKE